MTHKFKFYGYLDEKKIYQVKCSKTQGDFSTALWDLEKVQRDICPCCNEEINSGIEK